MTADELRTFGSRTWGGTYQAQIARGLGVADRTVRRWVAGASAIPEEAAAQIRALAERRAATRPFVNDQIEHLLAAAAGAGLDRAEVLAELVARAGALSAIADLAARRAK